MTSFRLFRFLLAALLMVALTGCTFINKPSAPVSQPLQDPGQVPALMLGDKAFKPDPGPVMADGKLYLPFIESLALLNIPTESFQKENAVIAYHDNRFLKIDTETLSLSRNGKSLPKTQAALLIKGTLFVQAAVIFDSFNLNVSYPKDGVIALAHQDNQENPQLVDGEYYIPIAVKEYDLQFSVPKTWNRLPGSPYRFGQSSDYENYQITFLTKPLEKLSDVELLEILAEEAGSSSDVQLYRDGVSSLQVNGLDGLSASFSYDRNNTAGRMFLYVFKRDQTAYVFQGWIDAAMDEAAVMRQITGIARSLRFGDMAVDVQREHYIEAPAFFDRGTLLASPLYSNMEVRGELELTGTVDDRGIKWLYAAVTRGGETITQKVPVTDKAFSAAIYTPFGLGKHDVTLYASKDERLPQDRILQVSIVNISPQETRWMIPTTVIDSDSDYITSQSSLLTYKTYGDYMKAKQLFSWIAETVTVKPSTNTPAKASDIYLKKSGSEQEIAILYAALLRATEIPARVMTGTGNVDHSWVEMQMNGQWVESDPVAAIERIKNGAPLEEAADAYFNMSRSYFEERYSKIDVTAW